MARIVNNFIKGRMNKDLDDRLIPVGEYRNALNAQVSKSEGENVGALENVLGNLLVGNFQFVEAITLTNTGAGYASGDYPVVYGSKGTTGGNGSGLIVNYDSSVIVPSPKIVVAGFGYEVGDFLTIDGGDGQAEIEITAVTEMRSIGFYCDELNNRIFVFLTENTGSSWSSATSRVHAIAYYDTNNETITLLASGSYLNFSQLFPITGVNLLDELLFFTDNLNQPRRINVNTAIADSTFYDTEDLISVAKYNPYESIELFKLSSNLTAASPATAKYETTMADVVSKSYPHGGEGNLGNGATLGDTTLELDRTSISGQINSVANYAKAATVAVVDTATQEMTPLLNGAGDQITVSDVDYYAASGFCDVDLSDPIQQDIALGQEVVFEYNEYYIADYNGDSDFLTDKFVRFAYRFKFEDGEYSIFSPFTQECFIPKQDGYFIYRVIEDQGNATTNDAVPQDVTNEEDTFRSTVVDFMENKVNRIVLRIPLPYVNSELARKLQIQSVDILYKESDGLNVNVIETIEINDIVNSTATAEFDAYGVTNNILELDNVTGGLRVGQMVSGPGIVNAPVVIGINGLTVSLSEEVLGLVAGDILNFGDPNYFEYEYQSKKPYKVLPESELTRTYDKVPVKALSQEIISNRVVYGNFQTKHTPPASLDYSVGISDKSSFSVGIGQAEVINGPFPIGSTVIDVDSGTVVLPITQNSTVTGTGIDTGTTLVEYDTAAATVELSEATTAIINAGDILTFTNQTNISNTTSIVEYPNSSLKQNRNYQVGITLSDRYGRTSTVILADKDASVRFQGEEFKSSTVFSDYITTLEPANDWPGNSLKILFNSIIGPEAANPGTLYPGIYNDDTTGLDYNPLGWYSFKVVVKQTEQEYYNVYLPGIMAAYPQDNTKEINKTSHFVLINDNINKVPRDLNEVGPLQTQFRSSVELYGRVQNNCGFTVDDWNEQFYPVGETPIVSTIATDRELFDAARVPGYQGTAEFYDVVSNPLIARLSTPSGRIGCPSTIVTCEAKALTNPALGAPAVVANATTGGGATVIPDTYWIGLDPATIVPDQGLGLPQNLQAVIISGQTMTAKDGVVPPVTVEIGPRFNGGDYYIQVFAPVKPVIDATDVLTFGPTPKFRFNDSQFFPVFSMPQLAVMETEPVDSLLDIFWETSTTGLINDLNTAVLNDTAGTVTIDGFVTTPFTEAIGNDSVISSNFQLIDASGNPISYVATSPPLLELISVTDGTGADRSSQFQIGELTPVSGTTFFNVKTAQATLGSPEAGLFAFVGNDPAPRTFAFTFRINYAAPGEPAIIYDIVKNNIVLQNETPTAAPGRPLPAGVQTTWISGDSTSIQTMFAVNGSAKESARADGMSWELNAIGSDGNNYGPFGFEITGSGASTGNNTFTISTGSFLNSSQCVVTLNTSAFPVPGDPGYVDPNPIIFTARAIDDGGLFVETTFEQTFDFDACRTWTLTMPQTASPEFFFVDYFECGGGFSNCASNQLSFQSDTTGASQATFCSKSNCPDPTIAAGSAAGGSLSTTLGSGPCVPGP